jgi:hypothetical protein
MGGNSASDSRSTWSSVIDSEIYSLEAFMRLTLVLMLPLLASLVACQSSPAIVSDGPGAEPFATMTLLFDG